MLTSKFEVTKDGMTVPYAPTSSGPQRNHGFVDLRGRPHLVSRVPESRRSPALKRLLMEFARSEATFVTLGCDLGRHAEIVEPMATRHVAGGYVQFVSTEYVGRVPVEYKVVAEKIEELVRFKSTDRKWEMSFVLGPAQLNLDGGSHLVPSVWIWFYAKAESRKTAEMSREALIGALREAISDHRAIEQLRRAIEDKNSDSQAGDHG